MMLLMADLTILFWLFSWEYNDEIEDEEEPEEEVIQTKQETTFISKNFEGVGGDVRHQKAPVCSK